MPSKPPAVEIEVDNRVVRVSNPDRVYFPESGATKLDLVEYYLAVGPGIVNALFERPCMLHRFPKGLAGDKVHQKRVAHVAHEVLDELGAVGFPKTSGSKGLHIYVRIRPDHGFKDVRRAALAFAREVERRAPEDVTTTWWRKDRDPHQLFVDYNQNARDHTIAAAYSVRGLPDARVSTPIRWDEVDDADPHDFTIFTVPGRFAELGDLHADIDDDVFDIAPLLEWAERDERAGKETPEVPES